MADNRDIVGLGSEQASFGKFIQFYSLQQNQIERNNVSLMAESNSLLQSSQLKKESLIELVRAYSSIWDISSPLYKDQQRKILVWFVFF